MILLTLWEILFISLMMNPLSAVRSLILLLDSQQSLPSSQTLPKSQTGICLSLGICLSILRNLTHSLSLFLTTRTIRQILPSSFSTTLSRRFRHSNSWIYLSDMISFGQATFIYWPPKSDLASSVVQTPSLAHLSCYPPPRLSSSTRWSTALHSGMAPLPQILLSLTAWKQKASMSLESPAMKLILWPYHFAISDRSVFSLSSPASFLDFTLCPLPALSSPLPSICRMHMFHQKSPTSETASIENTSHLHSIVSLFPTCGAIFLTPFNPILPSRYSR